jgi:hypothetical protein
MTDHQQSAHAKNDNDHGYEQFEVARDLHS